ncbi:MAG: bifunctional hydroxymethylpyrimidine kinase/phosphomethylpyrimidine kinase, partial [Candidatus Krumholzibacteria bacterium]|nr:bifunctional hydroxymethylpyrimidine kinase/phosphomethylpyrimidine kinase [Candidatus Krumholzibacteria bacterium]
NVAWTLVSLGLRVQLVGVLGKDYTAKEARSIIEDRGISTDFLVTDRSRATTEKIRIIAHNQQVVRADFESSEEIGGRVLRKLLLSIESAVEEADAVLISDYGKGVISSAVMDSVRKLCADRQTPFLVDPKEGHFSLYRGAYAVTPNKYEAGGFYGRKIRSEEDLESIGRSLLGDLEAEAVLVTRGEEGMTLFEQGRSSYHFPTRASEVYDVTGAGDTVISVLAAGIAAGASIRDSMELANAAAGIVVRELGTASVEPEELTGAFRW